MVWLKCDLFLFIADPDFVGEVTLDITTPVLPGSPVFLTCSYKNHTGMKTIAYYMKVSGVTQMIWYFRGEDTIAFENTAEGKFRDMFKYVQQQSHLLEHGIMLDDATYDVDTASFWCEVKLDVIGKKTVSDPKELDVLGNMPF